MKNTGNQEVAEKENGALRKKLLESLGHISWHGIPNILRSKHVFLKVILFLCFLASFTYCFYSIVVSIVSYFSYGVVVKIEYEEGYNLEFPAVSFCNLNPLDLSLPNVQSDVTAFLKNLTGLEGNYLYQSDSSNVTFQKEFCDSNTFKYFNQMENYYDDCMSIEKMLVYCRFNDQPCYASDFYSYQVIGLFGNCYSFNIGLNTSGNSVPVRTTQRPGVMTGFQLRLFVGAPEYQACWSVLAGVFVAVHNRTTPPIYTETGLKAATGLESNFALTRTIVKKLPAPFSDCIQNTYSLDELKTDYARQSFESDGVYTHSRCILNCALGLNADANLVICVGYNSTTKPTYNSCLINQTNMASFYPQCAPECPPECNTYSFDIQTSTAKFPPLGHAQYLINDPTILAKFPYSNVSISQLERSLVSFNVYFSSSTYSIIEEKPEMTLDILIGAIGGQFALFLGISVLSIVELGQILIELLIVYLRKKKVKLPFYKSAVSPTSDSSETPSKTDESAE